jgi:hypothetical protein
MCALYVTVSSQDDLTLLPVTLPSQALAEVCQVRFVPPPIELALQPHQRVLPAAVRLQQLAQRHRDGGRDARHLRKGKVSRFLIRGLIL